LEEKTPFLLGKALLLWCAQRKTVGNILPDDMVAPEQRTPDHLRFSVSLDPGPYLLITAPQRSATATYASIQGTTSSANASALQMAQKHNATSGRADEESQSKGMGS
jgi:hypothetical protein